MTNLDNPQDNRIEATALRQCLGQFATGVTVVTCCTDAGVLHGTTANSFTSVSLEPPLILWNIGKEARSLDAYLNAEHFAINILGTAQETLSSHFARSEDDLFAAVEHDLNDHGVPLLPNCLAHLECRTEQIFEAGDHHIILGRVQRMRSESGEPLLFFGGGYATLGASE